MAPRNCSGSGPATSPDDARLRQAARWERCTTPSPRRSSRPLKYLAGLHAEVGLLEDIARRYSAVNWRPFFGLVQHRALAMVRNRHASRRSLTGSGGLVAHTVLQQREQSPSAPPRSVIILILSL